MDSSFSGMAKPRKSQDEKELEKLAKKLLSMPPKPREESKIGKWQPTKPESGYKKGRRPDGSGRRLPKKD
jgi:hypothetical protein